MRTFTRTTLLCSSAALVLGLSACGSSDPSTVASAPGTTASAGVSAGGISAVHNDVDVAFIKDMTPHHAGALAMAELAPTRASNVQVKALAERIVAAQDPELQLMQQMATAWGVTVDRAAAGMSGMDMGSDATALQPLSGAAFDRAFLTAMTAHHSGALTMAQTELASGDNPQAKELANAIVAAQTAEIAEMTSLLKQV